MRLATSLSELNEALSQLNMTSGLGLVPTMGYLHEGHQALVRRSHGDGPTVVTVYVNPKQFGVGEDLERYPRDLSRDVQRAEEAGADVLFAPTDEEIYPPGYATAVHVKHLEDLHCGYYRPGHFAGVTTVLARLFGLIRPSRAYFGQKDYQQSVIVRRMVSDLALPIEIVTVPTVREPDGLALSSRNVYLTAEERRSAPEIHRILSQARNLFAEGETDAARLLGRTSAQLSRIPGFRIQYLTLVDPDTLAERDVARPGDVLLTAGYFGSTRLIDNQIL